MTVPTRPVLRWHGGKWPLAPWITSHFPLHRIYVEPYGGAASVLLRKPRAYAEIYNDLDMEVVNLFEVLRNETFAARLISDLRLTPFARKEFEWAYEETKDHIEMARQLVIRSFMGFGSDGFNRDVRTGFRAQSNRSGTTQAHDWSHLPDALALVVERLQGVVIENRPAMDVCRAHDSAATLHYLDPPYMPATRSKKSRKSGERYHAYRFEMTEADHVEMLRAIRDLTGMVVISGYPAMLYERELAGWERFERQALADGASPRTEVLWLNPPASVAMRRPRQGVML